MVLYNAVEITNNLLSSPVGLFTLHDLKVMLEITNPNTLTKTVQNLVRGGTLERIEKNKYLLNAKRPSDLAIANFCYQPSYISFETALNIHGILSQFPYEVGSATLKKPKTKKVLNNVFIYYHLQQSLFWGYQKQGDFLIAEPEKAILDQIYLSSKGLKSLSLDEYNYSNINQKKLKGYEVKFPKIHSFIALCKKMYQFLKI